MNRKRLLIPLLFLASITSLLAQEELTPVTKTYAIQNAHIIQKPGQALEMGTIVIHDGLIQAVGKDIAIPPNAKVLEADSMYVYAGFIDGIAHIGIPKPEVKPSSGNNRREKDAANPSYEKAGIQPQLQVRNLLNPKDKSIEEMRKLGYTAAHVVPRGNMLPGGGSLIVLNGEKVDDFIFKDHLSLFAQLQGASGVFPATLIAVMSKFRELYKRAEQVKVYEQSYNKNPVGKSRPDQDRVLQAFYPAIDKTQPVFFAAPAIKDIHRVFTLQEELGFSLVLTDVKQGWYLADKIKSTKTPVLLSLDLPKDKSKKEKKGDKKGEEGKEEKKKEAETATESKKVDKETLAFQKRQQESLAQYQTQAALFQDKGIPFGFTAINAKSSDIKDNLRTMIKHGLKEETALAALTTIPAEQLGVSQSMGTIEKGKLANLVISDKPYFEEKSNVRFVMIEGQVFEYEVPKKKKEGTDTSVPAKIAGTWKYELEIQGSPLSGILTLTDNEGSISGTITNSEEEGSEDIEDVTVDGNEITFLVPTDDTGTVKATLNLTINGDVMEGTANIPGMGSFDIEVERVP